VSDRLKIHLIRHPTPAVAPNVCYGQTDLPLADPPSAAAMRLLQLLPAIDQVFSSPLRRCHELASALAAGSAKPLTADPRLMEIDFGEWEGRSWNEVPRQLLDQWAAAPFDFAPPQGESAAAMAERVIAFADDLVAAKQGKSGELAVVSHQGPLRVLIAHWLDLPRASWLKLQLDCAASNCIEISRHGNRLLWLNR